MDIEKDARRFLQWWAGGVLALGAAHQIWCREHRIKSVASRQLHWSEVRRIIEAAARAKIRERMTERGDGQA